MALLYLLVARSKAEVAVGETETVPDVAPRRAVTRTGARA
jgi:hypothetical protein